MSKVLVISTSLRPGSNSDLLAERMIQGARDAGHQVEQISLKGRSIAFCTGCLSCQKTQVCAIKDDAVEICDKVCQADSLVFTTPIYYYEMSGQMKTLLDRLNPLYTRDYRFRRVYLLSTATEDEDYVPQRALRGLEGWAECFEKAELSGALFCGGVTEAGEAASKTQALEEAYLFGRSLA